MVIDETEQFRVLFVDNDGPLLREFEEILTHRDGIAVKIAATQESAVQKLEDYYFDAIYMDLETDVPGGGYELMKDIAQHYRSSTVIPISKHVDDDHFARILDMFGSGVPSLYGSVLSDVGSYGRLTSFLDKTDLPLDWSWAALEEEYRAWSSSAIRTSGLAEVVDNIERERSRIPRLRHLRGEIEVEVERLLRQVFGRAEGGDDGAPPLVRLTPVTTQGLSAASTFDCSLVPSSLHADDTVQVVRTVLKIGPRLDIEAEVDRFDRFVRFGVHLRHRVEILGWAYAHSLACIVYSFAGGLHGPQLWSLDQLIDTDPQRGRTAINELFQKKNKSWYGITSGGVSPASFVSRHYGFNVNKRYRHVNRGLTELASSHPDIQYSAATNSDDGVLDLRGVKLKVPRRGIFGDGKLLRRARSCMVHGDLHGGNVLVEGDASLSNSIARVCLIDFRHAGVGPVATDAVMLQLSVRLADARKLEASPVGDANIAAAERSQQELQMLRRWLLNQGNTDESKSAVGWRELDREIYFGLWESFGRIEPIEYLSTGLVFGVRMLSYRLRPVERIRICAFVGALYTLWLREPGGA
jgi:CheY-like chemotaxis protein